MNKGKRSIQVDMRSPEGRELLTALATEPGVDAGAADNFPTRGWLDFDALRERRRGPDHGQHHRQPRRQLGGRLHSQPGDRLSVATGPRHLGVPFNHCSPPGTRSPAASLRWVCWPPSASASGRNGQHVTIALSDVAIAMVGHLGKIAEAQVLRRDRQKDGNYLYGAFGRDFLTKDGRRVMIVALTDQQWEALVKASGMQRAFGLIEETMGLDLDLEGDRFTAREVLGGVLKPWTITHTYEELSAILDEHGVCWGPYQTFMQLVTRNTLLAKPEFEARPPGRQLPDPAPLNFTARAAPVRRAPALVSTPTILAEFGDERGEIAGCTTPGRWRTDAWRPEPGRDGC